jgi:ubiquinone biosynthesis protein COQ9
MSDDARRQRQALRDRLLEAALPHVVFDGWGMTALAAGAADAAVPEYQIHAAFISPENDLLAHFSDWADRRMLERLAEKDLSSMKIRERIATAVRVRLEVLGGHEEAVRRAIGARALPGRAGTALRDGYRTVDAIWRAAGDRSTDFNFYSKRGLLAAVMVSTTLFWLDDQSNGHEETWAFLNRRIDEILQIPKMQARFSEALERLMRPLGNLAGRARGA